jgi:tRNA (mo5U34)-methyltransferase
VSGLRCLDVGTSDGFLAFELERRGAAEVLAVDLAAHEQWDWEAHMGAHGPQYLRAVAGPSMGDGFRVARELRGSSVQFAALSAYDLTPERVGTNQVDLERSVGPRRAPLVRLDGTSGITQWWIPNAAGHRQMLQAAGFDIERQSALYSIPFGPAHPPRGRDVGSRLRGLAERLLTGNEGVPHVALLARRDQSTGAR